ncbi:MAG: LLM class flavin-dependent oxidoreductase [Cenarchaeum sp. SB0661_bin_35]|nr:LLM class flavin-dependent oxidoreductase [Cenarchaeum sp. SB0667_bin_13]MXZ93227.1 LLM class flavin-dependent oxidoreductase [Cenarchaeum sp. SB0666_bin_15]MYB46558.1 LLM class flavin-dependent oxidoreductase [Cenarchaeum sp. SB0662_bin_33]MYC79264.1 LLM class flavin-dependent oxidoreductase [Cenarchaeum sp. SB0661_bin_35]MYJ27780.1 LLM class flavin-dependent oxidoreductase [Cenarchaeum sp. SB0672_bin_9]
MSETRIGVELGIRAPAKAVRRAAELAGSYAEYFLVPETHPRIMGVDALDMLLEVSAGLPSRARMGTGIINVFSRTREDMLCKAIRIHRTVGERFILGIGTSAPVVVEGMWKMVFHRPVSRLVSYTRSLRAHGYAGPIYWAAVGERVLDLAIKNADGVIFFLKPRSHMPRHVRAIREGASPEFGIISIIPVSMSSSTAHDARMDVKMTVAGYVGANGFYGEPLAAAGFDVAGIRDAYRREGVRGGARMVGDSMLDEVQAVWGTPESCARRIHGTARKSEADVLVLGFDLPPDKYDDVFFEDLDILLRGL